MPLIENPALWTGRLRYYQHFAWGDPPPSKVLPLEAVLKTRRYTFQIIHTPGHSPDHICLLEPEQGWLFAGDVFVREKVPTLRSDENIKEMLASLHKLLQYEFSTLYCSSGTVVSNAKAALKRKIAYWEELGEKIIKLYKEGIEPEEIRERLLGKETVLYGPSEGDFGKINLVNSFIQSITNQPDSGEERQ
jgi:glyoxylase-like metal-dependent hydrolase (beta-lactamase superfamily II)